MTSPFTDPCAHNDYVRDEKRGRIYCAECDAVLDVFTPVDDAAEERINDALRRPPGPVDPDAAYDDRGERARLREHNAVGGIHPYSPHYER